jgi:hypothetical protein
MVIKKRELIDLTQLAYGDDWKGIIPSGGGCDEWIRLYLLQRKVTRDVLDQLEGRLTGLAEEGEVIKLHILPLKDVWRASPDAKCLAALTLYRELQAEGVINGATFGADSSTCGSTDDNRAAAVQTEVTVLPANRCRSPVVPLMVFSGRRAAAYSTCAPFPARSPHQLMQVMEVTTTARMSILLRTSPWRPHR